MLEKQAHFNDLSPKLRKKLEQRVNDFGDSVRYRFNISHPDPHPDNRGQLLWPSVWTLGPVTFQIMDNEEDRPTAQKLKNIGLVKTTDPEKGHPIDFRRIQVLGIREGYLQIDLRDPQGIEDCMFLELHPKHTGGLFFDKSKGEGLFQRIDELAAARANRSTRETRRAAMNVAADFSEKETRDFVSALGRDENRDIDILGEELAELADKQPLLFTKEFNTGNWQWRATLKRALDKQILIHHPVEDKVTMNATQEAVAVLTRMESDTRSINHRLADALQAQGDTGTKMMKRLEALVKAQVVA